MVCAAAAAAIFATSCNNDDGPSNDEYINFATLENRYTGGCSFVVQQNNNTIPATLFSSVELPSGFTIGKRYVIQYSNENAGPFTSGPITLLNAFEPFSGEAKVVPMDTISPLMSDPINNVYFNNVGKWLDVQSYAYVSYAPKAYGVYIDAATINEEYPEAYLGFKSDSKGDGKQYILYGSFDISPIKQLPNARGFNLTYQYNNIKKTQQFDF